jgi:predicted restriction endonuclease
VDFKQWIIDSGRSEKTAKNYHTAIVGSISNWARDAGLVTDSLLEVRNPKDLENLIEQIKELDEFIANNSRGNSMYSAALKRYLAFLEEMPPLSDVQSDLERILEGEQPSTETRLMLEARLGQGLFRQRVVEYWKRCAVTGFEEPSLLIASHIKPWRVANDHERLDTYNGLLLIPNLDKVFDTGHISFDEDGQIMLSNNLPRPEILGISADMKVLTQERHQNYMEHHRTHVFLG